MQPINAQVAALLRKAVRAPRAYAQIQLPLITSPTTGTLDYQKLGSQYVEDKITTLRRESLLAIGSDQLQFSFNNTSGIKSSISPTAPLGRYYFPGAADNKVALYLGIFDSGAETVYPKGVYVSKALNQQNQNGQNPGTFNCLDQFYICRGDVYTQFPTRLYGNQQSTYYNPNYALNNPSGDLTTYVCDAVDWMSSAGQNQAFANDYIAVAVYTSDISSGSVVTTHSYTLDYVHGTVTFGSPLPSGTTVSVDARPLAMTPELMLYHLFVDYAGLDPDFLRFDKSGIYLPVMQNAYDVDIVTVAQEIVMAVAPKGVRWVLYFDGNGNLIFTEPAVDGPPVVSLVDTFDILRCTPEYTSDSIANVVRATATCITNQNLEAIAYDVRSINIFSQKPTYDIPSQMLAAVVGQDTGSGMTFLNGLVNSFLFENSLPVIQTEIDILYNPALEVGDSVQVYDTSTGLNKQCYITQITETIDGPDITQTLKIQQYQASQDFQFGLSFYAGAAQDMNANQIQTASSLIQGVTFNGITVVTNGQPAMDEGYNPIVPTWNGGSLPISITLGAIPGGGVEYIWRWMYLAEDVYTSSGLITGNGQGVGLTLPSPYSTNFTTGGPSVSTLVQKYSTAASWAPFVYDVAANNDSSRSRRFWWPLMRCSDWVSNDGITSYSGSTTLSSTWSGGPGVSSTWNTYGQLRVGLSDYFGMQSSAYLGQALYASGTPAATALGSSSTSKYGVDFGPTISGTAFYGIKRTQTPGYLGILVASTSGVVQMKRIPFTLVS